MSIFPIANIANGIVSIGEKVIDHFFPDPTIAAEKKLELYRMQRDGELEELKINMSAILMEAQSADPWTSRARPSFLYVMYAIILAAVPMGILHAFDPSLAMSISEGFGLWLKAIPEEMWWLFGAGYLGYTGFRSHDKSKILEVSVKDRR